MFCLDFQASTNVNHAKSVEPRPTKNGRRNKQTKTCPRSHNAKVFKTPTPGARKSPAQRKALFCILFWANKRVWRLRAATRGLDLDVNRASQNLRTGASRHARRLTLFARTKRVSRKSAPQCLARCAGTQRRKDERRQRENSLRSNSSPC